MAEACFHDVSKRFGDTHAVRHLELTIADRELVVLLGPTGAGKTTSLRLLAGLERPDDGRISIDGRDVTRSAPADRNVAFVFQQYSLYPHYTVFDNLAFPLRAPGRRRPEKEIEQRVKDIAQLLGIASKLGNRATQLSGGEMQRVAIGRALVRTPSLYLMDEPLSSLDAKLREDLRVELKRIQRDLGATILYVTHDQLEAMTLADRIGVLSEGELVQVGTPREIYEFPNNVHVARRLGSPPINLLRAGTLDVGNIPTQCETLGVRPEDLRLGERGASATVLAIENLGVETVVLLDLAGQHTHALLPGGAHVRTGTSIEQGSTTTVSARPGASLFFNAAGNRINAERTEGLCLRN